MKQSDSEVMVNAAKQSFEQVLSSDKYKSIIKDDIVWIGEIEVTNMVFVKEGERAF